MVNMFNPGEPCRGGYPFSPGDDPENSQYRITVTGYPVPDDHPFPDQLCHNLFVGERTLPWRNTTTGLNSCGSRLPAHAYETGYKVPAIPTGSFLTTLLLQSTPCFPRYNTWPSYPEIGQPAHNGQFGNSCTTWVRFIFGGIYSQYSESFWYDVRDNQFKRQRSSIGTFCCPISDSICYAFKIVRINPDLSETLCIETFLPEIEE